jgi:hypothetical protein
MKISISRQSIYLVVTSTVLLLFVTLFSFLVLIPEGKNYREQRIELKKESKELQKYQNFHDETLERLKELQGENRHIIQALDTSFNPQRFEKIHKEFFSSLVISEQTQISNEDDFYIYEVNTTSHINSPQSFYNFLDAVNKSDWVIGINFPINFKRDGDLIKSSFTMRVYNANKSKKIKVQENEELNASE